MWYVRESPTLKAVVPSALNKVLEKINKKKKFSAPFSHRVADYVLLECYYTQLVEARVLRAGTNFFLLSGI